MPPTWGPKRDLLDARADDWLSRATADTESFLRGLGWSGSQAQADPEPLNIRLPSADEFFNAAPWRTPETKRQQQPAASPMPTNPSAPGTVDATFVDGRREPQDRLRPGEQVGDIHISQGPRRVGNPEVGVEQWDDIIQEAARAYGVDPSDLKGLMEIESGGRTHDASGRPLRSSAGATSLMQVMPFHFGPGEDPDDPRTNIMKGAKVYADGLRRWGDPRKAAAAYFGAIDGEGNITNATDGSSVDGHAYVRLWENARAKYAGTPNAGATVPAQAAPLPAPAAAVQPASPQAAPAAAGAPVTMRHKVTGNIIEVDPSQLPFMTNKAEFDVVPSGTMQKAAGLPASGGMSAGDQKRARLAAYNASGGESAGSAGSMPAPGLPETWTQPGTPTGEGPALSYRNPILPPTDPEATTGEYIDPDSGPRETGYTVPPDPAQYAGNGDDPGYTPTRGVVEDGASAPVVGPDSATTSPRSTYAPPPPEITYVPPGTPLDSDAANSIEVPITPGRPRYEYQYAAQGSPLDSDAANSVEVPVRPRQQPMASSYNDPTDGGTLSQPLPSAGGEFLDLSFPSPPGWQAIVDGAGNVVRWVRERIQNASDSMAAADAPISDEERRNRAAVAGLEPGQSLRYAPGSDPRPPIQSLPGEPDYAPKPSPFDAGGILEPMGGLPRIQERIQQIKDMAARDRGVNRGSLRAMYEAADDPAWRAANPALAAEYDELQQQLMMAVGGQVGDSGIASRVGQAAEAPAFRARPGNLPEELTPHVIQRGPGGVYRNTEPARVVGNAAERGIDTLYHETDPRTAFNLTSEMGTNRLTGLYVSPDPAFALGQGGKGAVVEFGNTGEIRLGRGRQKPGLAMMDAAGEGNPEWVIDDAPQPPGQYIRAITVAPDARMDPVSRGISRGLEQDGWTVETLADGSRRFTPPSQVADDGVRMLGSGVVPEGNRRMYHGTASEFGMPDPAKFDENGLFGPGYYLTSDPRVASSYSTARGLGTTPGVSPSSSANAEPLGANVRAIDVPSSLRLLDIDGPTTAFDTYRMVSRAAKATGDPRLQEVADHVWRVGRDAERSGLYTTWQDAFDEISAALDDPAAANRAIAAAGYDGITHRGGKRVPLMDEAGNPIEHDVTIVFPESLTKIRNAFSGEAGGSGFIPSRATLANAAQGGVFGAASEDVQAQQEGREPDSGERMRRAVAGAGLGAAAGIAARGGAGRRLGSGFVNSPSYKPPTPQQIQAAERQGARRGAMLNREVTPPGTAVPLRVRAAVRATDDRAGLRWAEDMLTDTAGSPRLRENDPARPSTQSRVNTGSIADERITADLEPAVIRAAEDDLQAELPQYLEDMHAKDVLDEFYGRGRQAVLDDRAEKIAAAQARGASPQVIQRMQAKAAADAEVAGERAMRKRQGGNADMTYEAIEARLQAQEGRLKADGRWDSLQESAQGVWDHNAATRQRLVDAGEVDPQDAAYWAQAYPHYVPTVPISHLDARGGGPVASATGPRVSRGNQKSVHALEDVGTSGERLNPIVASRNATVRAERQIQRNEVARAFAQMMDDALQASPGTMATDPATHRTFLGGGVDVTYMENGKPVTLSVPKVVADGLEAAANMGANQDSAGRIWRTVMGAVTASMTAGRASFLPVNLARDLQDYAARTAAKEGGPHKLPGILGTWFEEAGKAAADIARAQVTGRGMIGAATGFAGGAVQGDEDTTLGERLVHGAEGAVAGTFLLGANKVKATGKAREYAARGGGSGVQSAHWTAGQRWYRDVMRDGGAPIKSVQDAVRHLGDWLQDVATLQGVKGINERTELISRTAAMRRGDAQGLAPTEAMIRGRDASYDPDRAGTVARMLNGWIPFFNASVQGGAQTARLIRDHPAAFAATVATTTAPIMLGVEAWNRSDPERARIYDDIPQYIKDTGVVAVLPWAGSDNRGERPNYLWIPTGGQTPFVIGMRKAMEGLPGLEPTAGRGKEEGWADVLGTIIQTFSPIRGDSLGAAASNFVPQIAKQAIELGTNRDMYRGNPITTDNSDERASAASRSIAGGLNAAGRAIGNDWLQEVRPSGVEHVVRALPAYGDLVTGASDMVAPSGYKQAEQRPVQNEPFVGGIAGRFIRDTGGANLERAQDERLGPVVRDVLLDAGLRPSDVEQATKAPSFITQDGQKIPLERGEQIDYQERMNVYIEREMGRVQRSPEYRKNPEQAIKDAMRRGRERAEQEVLRQISPGTRRQRVRDDAAMKAS